MNIATHLILVSDQPIPNITPILDEETKPQKVIMLISENMQERARALENIFRTRGVTVEAFSIEDPWDANRISDTVLDILCNYPLGDIALNATGGTKLMSIAACEAFRSANAPIYYVHPKHGKLLWLSRKQPSHKLADRLKLRDYLMAYGADQVDIPPDSPWTQEIQAMTRQLLIGIDRYADELGTLNYLAYNANNPQLMCEIKDSHQNKPILWELLGLFQNAGICQFDQRFIHFTDQQARFIANGGWLEMHVYATCSKLRKLCGIQDIASNISIQRHPAGKAVVKNEIDVAFISANRLYMIECKTKQIGKNADMLYKLDSLRDLMGGLQGRAMLISFNGFDKAGRARAKELNIALCSKMELQNLQFHLQEWLSI